MPLLPCDLVLLSALWKKVAQVVHHEDDTFHIVLKNCLVFNGFLRDRLPFLNLCVLNSTDGAKLSFSFNLWHNCLDHIDP